jgi:large repetitive protein
MFPTELVRHPRFRWTAFVAVFLFLPAAAFAVPPVANNASLTTNEDTDGTVTLSGSDSEFGTYTWNWVTPPAHGEITAGLPGDSGTFLFRDVTYRPNGNYFGPDSFTYTIKNNINNETSSPATVTITVEPQNDKPVADPKSVSVNEGSSNNAITLSGSDVEDGTNLTYELQGGGPSHGELGGTAPNLTYTPDPGYSGSDSFKYRVRDTQNLASDEATVSITVVPQNDPPQANNQNVSTNEDTPLTFDLDAVDPDGDPMTFEIVSGPTQGSLSGGTGRSRTYTPNANYNGTDSFTFKAKDAGGESNVATVIITINPVNDPPNADAGVDQFATEGTGVGMNGTASSDIDAGDALTFQWIQLSGTSVTLLNPNTAIPSFVAPQVEDDEDLVFELTVTDKTGAQDTDQTTVHIQNSVPGNNPPINVNAGPDAFVFEETDVALRATAEDPDGDPLSYHWLQLGGPVVVIASPTAQNTSFAAPSVDNDTVISFQVTVTDGRGGIGSDSVIYVVKNSAPGAALPVNALLTELDFYPSPYSPASGPSTIRFQLREEATVRILIVDIFGREVDEFSASGVRGNNEVRWDGQNEDGNTVGNGAYIVQVFADNGNGQNGKLNERFGVKN